MGLIVNPIAGIGGRVGLKGSDGEEIQKKALDLGAVPGSHARTVRALEKIMPICEEVEVITYPGEMGEVAAKVCGLRFNVIGAIQGGKTTAADTRDAAREMLRLDVDLLLFAGGDGTARDIYEAIGEDLMALGIPAGVKIHSAVYARNPESAGELAVAYLQGKSRHVREAEVMDIDEKAFRQGRLSAKLYGYLKTPFQRRYLQGLKSGSVIAEQASLEAIAQDVVENMEEDTLYIIGPGTTTRAITSHLGLEKTLLGVDVIRNRQLIAADVNEEELMAMIDDRKARIIITPIGGQGFLFGRGNQQISPQLIKRVGAAGIIVVSTEEKLQSLDGRPFLVDSGDREVDKMLSGYTRVVTGYGERSMYRVSA